MSILDIVHKARTLESRIARALTHAAGEAAGATAPEPLEIAHAIVDAIERQVQPGSRGTRLFPFNRLTIAVLAGSRAVRAQFEALFAAAPSLRDRIVDRLRSAGCDVSDLQVEVAYVGRAGRDWEQPQFQIVFERIEAAAAPPPAPIESAPARLEVTVLHGVAERRTYSFTAARIDLGRGVEVRDGRRLLRTNHVAYVEGASAVNQTVSRRHAHIAVDAAGGHRLHDDGSAHGTGIVRGGRTIPVPAGARGVRLRSGDEIALGEARVRIRIDNA